MSEPPAFASLRVPLLLTQKGEGWVRGGWAITTINQGNHKGCLYAPPLSFGHFPR